MAQEVDYLSVKIAGKFDDNITADSLIVAMREMIGILKELDPENTLVWKLKDASLNSPLSLTFAASPRSADRDWRSDVSRIYLTLFRRLDQGEIAEAPSARAILHAKKLVDILNDGVSRITFSAPGAESVTPTQRVQATVDEFKAAHRETYRDFTTLEGELRTVSVDGGSKFFIRDRATATRTECIIPHDQLDSAKQALEKRVSVTGRVLYKNGKPIKIDVESFEMMPDRSSLPQFNDIRGIDPTGGLDSVEFIRRGRDAD